MTSRQRVSSFFVLVEERRHKVVKGIRTERGLAKDLAALFEGQAVKFLGPDIERIPFEPRFKPDDDHVFEIKGFSLPEHIEKAVKSPDGVDPFILSMSEPVNMRSVFASSYDHTSGAIAILMQRSNRSRILEAGQSFFVSGDTFRRLNEPGLTLDSELIAVFDAGDPDALSQLCDMTMRKRVAYIKASGILDKVTARKICSGLKSIFDDIDITWTSRGGTERLKLPKTKRDLKRVLNHLCEAYYIGDLTGEKYEASSHRRVTR